MNHDSHKSKASDPSMLRADDESHPEEAHSSPLTQIYESERVQHLIHSRSSFRTAQVNFALSMNGSLIC